MINFADIAAKAESGDYEGATQVLGPYLDSEPNDPRALYIMGYVFLKLEKPGLAYQVMTRAVELVPQMAAAWHNLGKTCYEMQRFDEADCAFRRALALDQRFVNSLDGVGLVSLNRANFEDAIGYCSRAIAEKPGLMDSMVNRGMAYLGMERWEEGWRGYNCNFGNNKDRKERCYSGEPRWDGSKGKNLVVFGEQGIGDEINFGSCIADLIRDSASVVIECDKRLETVFRRTFPDQEVRGTRYDSEITWVNGRNFDAHVSFGQLPQFYRRTNSDFPSGAYLIPDPELRLMFKARFDSLPKKPRIGITWNGGIAPTGKAVRSIALETLLPILEFDAHWVSLEYKPPKDLDAFNAKHNLNIMHWPWAVQCYDYDITLALIAELDMVITVTQTAVHAAGALGKECWCLVPSRPIWMYGRSGRHFHWAKSVELFRQQGSDWPIAEVRQRLEEKFSDSGSRNERQAA